MATKQNSSKESVESGTSRGTKKTSTTSAGRGRPAGSGTSRTKSSGSTAGTDAKSGTRSAPRSPAASKTASSASKPSSRTASAGVKSGAAKPAAETKAGATRTRSTASAASTRKPSGASSTGRASTAKKAAVSTGTAAPTAASVYTSSYGISSQTTDDGLFTSSAAYRPSSESRAFRDPFADDSASLSSSSSSRAEAQTVEPTPTSSTVQDSISTRASYSSASRTSYSSLADESDDEETVSYEDSPSQETEETYSSKGNASKYDSYDGEKKKSGKGGLFALVAAGILLAGGGATYAVLNRGKESKPEDVKARITPKAASERENILSLASRYMDEGEYGQAVSVLAPYVSENPDDSEAVSMLERSRNLSGMDLDYDLDSGDGDASKDILGDYNRFIASGDYLGAASFINGQPATNLQEQGIDAANLVSKAMVLENGRAGMNGGDFDTAEAQLAGYLSDNPSDSDVNNMLSQVRRLKALSAMDDSNSDAARSDGLGVTESPALASASDSGDLGAFSLTPDSPALASAATPSSSRTPAESTPRTSGESSVPASSRTSSDSSVPSTASAATTSTPPSVASASTPASSTGTTNSTPAFSGMNSRTASTTPSASSSSNSGSSNARSSNAGTNPSNTGNLSLNDSIAESESRSSVPTSPTVRVVNNDSATSSSVPLAANTRPASTASNSSPASSTSSGSNAASTARPSNNSSINSSNGNSATNANAASGNNANSNGASNSGAGTSRTQDSSSAPSTYNNAYSRPVTHERKNSGALNDILSGATSNSGTTPSTSSASSPRPTRASGTIGADGTATSPEVLLRKYGTRAISRADALDVGQDFIDDAKYDEAINLMKELLTLNSRDIEARRKLEEAEALKKKYGGNDGARTTQQNLDLARRWIDSGNYDDAITLLNSILNKDPNNREAQELLKKAIDGKNGIDPAKKQAERDSKMDMVKRLLDNGEYDKAIALLNQILADDPNDSEARNLLNKAAADKKNRDAENARKINDARKALENGDYDDAIARLNEILKNDPNNAEAKNLLNQAKADKARADAERNAKIQEAKKDIASGDIDDAIAALQKILAENPDDAEARTLLNQALNEKARAEAEKKAEADRQAKLDEARRALENGDYDKAQKILNELLKSNPDDPEAKRLLNQAQEAKKDAALKEAEEAIKNGDFEKAQKILNDLLKDNPNDNDTKALMNQMVQEKAKAETERQKKLDEAREAIKNGDYDKAQKILNELLKDNPDDATAKSLLDFAAKEKAAKEAMRQNKLREAQEAIRNGDYDKAQKILDDLLKDNPDDAQAKNLLKQAQDAKAKAEADRQAKLKEAENAIKNGDYAKAEQILGSLLKNNPGDSDAKDLLKQAQDGKAKAEAERQAKLKEAENAIKNGDYDKAQKILNELLKDNPGDSDAKNLLKQVQDEKSKSEAERKNKLKEAEDAIKNGDYAKAEKILNELLKNNPNDSDAKKLLDQSKDAKAKADAEKAKQEKLARAQKLIDEGKFDEAEKLLNEVLKDNPNDAKAKELLGKTKDEKAQAQKEAAQKIAQAKTALANGDYDKAISLLNEALKADPNNAEAKSLLEKAKEAKANQEKEKQAKLAKARSLINSGDYDGAISLLNDMLKADPNDSQAKTLLTQAEAKKAAAERDRANKLKQAQNNIDNGNYDAAIATLNGLLQKNPNDTEAKKLLDEATKKKAAADKIRDEKMAQAQKHYDNGEWDKAINVLNDILKDNPKDTQAKNLLNQATAKKRAEEKAAAAAKDKADKIAQAKQAMKDGDYDKAVSTLTALARSYPNDPEISSLLDEAKKKKADADRAKKIAQAKKDIADGKYDNAISAMNALLKTNPNDTEAKSVLADAQAKKTAAQNAAKEAARKQNLEKAKNAIAKGDYDGAISILNGLLKENPSDKEAQALLKEAQDKKAENDVAAKAEKERQAKLAQARTLMGKGDYDGAISILDGMLKDNPKDADAKALKDEATKKKAAAAAEKARNENLAKARSLIAAGKYDDAIALLNDMLKADPNDAQAKTLLTQATTKKAAAEKDRANKLAQARNNIDAGKYDAAISTLNGLLKTDPNDKEAKALLDEANAKKAAADKAHADKINEAKKQIAAKNYDKAEEILNGLLKENPNDTEAKNLLKDLNAKRDAEKKAAAEKERADKLAQAQKLIAAGDYDKAAEILNGLVGSNSKDADAQKLLKDLNSKKDAEAKAAQEAAEKAAREQAKQQAESEIAKGKTALAKGNVEDALDHFAKAKSLLPANDPAYSAEKLGEMAKALYDAAQNTKNAADKAALDKAAAEYANAALAKDPSNAPAHYVLGMQAMDAKNYAKAETELAAAAKLDPKNATYWYQLGRAQAMQRKYAPAATSFQKAIECEPTLASAYYNLGYVQEKSGNTDAALTSYRNAYKVDSGYERAYMAAGRLMSSNGDYKGAIEAFSSAVKINPSNAQTYQELGQAYSNNGDLKGAESAFRKALAYMDPSKPDATTYYNLSSVLSELGKYSEGVNYAKQAYDNRGTTSKAVQVNITYTYGLLCEKTGKISQAIELYEEALSLDGMHLKSKINLGGLYLKQGDVDSAITFLTSAYNQDSSNFEANNNLGNAYSQKGDASNAVKYYQNALRLNSSDNTVRENLAKTYAAAGQYSNAKVAYEDVIDAEPENWSAYLEAAKVDVKLGNNEDAIQKLEYLQTHNPSFSRTEVNVMLNSLR